MCVRVPSKEVKTLPTVADIMRWVKVMSVELEDELDMLAVLCSSIGILSWFCLHDA